MTPQRIKALAEATFMSYIRADGMKFTDAVEAGIKAAVDEETAVLRDLLRDLVPHWVRLTKDNAFTGPEAERAAALSQRIAEAIKVHKPKRERYG